MKQTILGLAALLVVSSGCQEENPSTYDHRSIGSEQVVMIPRGCQKIIDVRYQTNGSHQVVCEDKDDKGVTKLTLYSKRHNDNAWTAIHYRR